MNKALISKIELIELKIKYAKYDLESNQDYIITLDLKYIGKIDDLDFKDKSILKLIKNTKMLVRYYEKRINTLYEDWLRNTKRLNEDNRHIEAMI